MTETLVRIKAGNFTGGDFQIYEDEAFYQENVDDEYGDELDDYGQEYGSAKLKYVEKKNKKNKKVNTKQVSNILTNKAQKKTH